MARKRAKRWIGLLILSLLLWFTYLLWPMPSGPSRYIRFNKRVSIGEAIQKLSKLGVVRSPFALGILARLLRRPEKVHVGTYNVAPGMSGIEVLRSITEPVRFSMRLPETNWALRTSHLLEEHGVATSADYMHWVHDPQAFAGKVSFPLPKSTLEGFLFPDTYDLPPLLGGYGVVRRQLDAFENKVWIPLGKPKNIETILKIASLIELEVARNNERPLVSAVIYNRLRRGMPLEIDASINYGLKMWRPLRRSEYHSIKSPYNLYLHKGLPPTPICSPTYNSIVAAMHPAQVNYLYYVAMPNGTSLFASTYLQHLKNIQMRKRLLREEAPIGSPKT